MSKLNFTKGLHFELLVMDLCEMVNPKKADDLNEFSEDLHERIEMAIEDYISDAELSGEYVNQY